MSITSFVMLLFVICLITVGFLSGIMFEILNYRREIRSHVKYLSEIRDNVNSTIDENDSRLSGIESKVEMLDMFINSKR